MSKKNTSYQVIKQKLFSKIAERIHQDFINLKQEHDNLPSENQLSSHYQVSRTTIRRALAELVESEKIYSVHGSGRYIRSNKRRQHSLNFVLSFHEVAKKEKVIPFTKVLDFRIQAADAFHAEKLNIKQGDLVYFTKRTRYLNKFVHSIEIGYMPVSLFPDLSIEILSHSKYEYITQQKNKKIKSHNLELIPAHPPQEIADILNIPLNTPLIITATTSYFDTGEIFEYTEAFKNPANHQFLIHIEK